MFSLLVPRYHERKSCVYLTNALFFYIYKKNKTKACDCYSPSVTPKHCGQWGALCAFITLEAIPIRALVRGGFKNAGHVCGKDQRNCNAWLSRLRIERWVNESPPQKKYTITETRHSFQDGSLVEKCGRFTRNGIGSHVE